MMNITNKGLPSTETQLVCQTTLGLLINQSNSLSLTLSLQFSATIYIKYSTKIVYLYFSLFSLIKIHILEKKLLIITLLSHRDERASLSTFLSTGVTNNTLGLQVHF